MSKPTFINLPVTNLDKSTEFYLSLGFTIDTQFSVVLINNEFLEEKTLMLLNLFYEN